MCCLKQLLQSVWFLPRALLNLVTQSDWLARQLSLQMFTDWIMELSLLLLIQGIAFPYRISP